MWSLRQPGARLVIVKDYTLVIFSSCRKIIALKLNMKGATSGASQVHVEKNAEVVSVSIRTCIWKLWKSEAIDQGRKIS